MIIDQDVKFIIDLEVELGKSWWSSLST